MQPPKKTVRPGIKTLKVKENKRQKFDVAEFGKRLAMVREQIIGLSQNQFAPLVNTKQGLLSRLEAGIGGNIHMAFEIVDYLNRNGFRGHMLFRAEFNIGLLKSEVGEMANKQMLIDELDAIGEAAKANYLTIVAIKGSIS